MYNNAGPYTRDATYYIAAAWARENISRVPESYTLGDRSTTVANTVMYTNAELNPDTAYSIFVRIDIESDAGGEVILILMCLHSRTLPTSNQEAGVIRLKLMLCMCTYFFLHV